MPAPKQRPVRSWATLAALALAVAVLALPGLAHAAPQPPTTPPELQPPPGHEVYLKVVGKGVQIYECRAQGSGFAWVLVGPKAVLFDTSGRRMGSHYVGPTWEAVTAARRRRRCRPRRRRRERAPSRGCC